MHRVERVRAASQHESFLITGSRVYTGDPAAPWAEAVVTRGNRIAYVGNEAEARLQGGTHTEVIHVPGGLVTAGLNDSHAHLNLAAYNLTTLNLEGATTLEMVQTRLREYAAAHPERAWIEGYGLSYEPFAGLHRAERFVLDEVVPDRSVFLRAFDFHSAWCNTLALQRAGIDRGANMPAPNDVVVDPQTGDATGMLKEQLACKSVTDLIDPPTPEQLEAMLLHATQYVNCLGITSVQNMDATRERLEQFQRLHERGELTVRANHYMSVGESTPLDYLDECVACAHQYSDPWNHTTGIKMFIDGVVESKTALMMQPYADGSGDTGVPDMNPDVHRDMAKEAHALGLDVATHAIGDRGVHLVLDAYEAAQQAHNGRGDRRHRIEHIEVIQPPDIGRFAALGITASMQPLHAAPTTDPRYTPWTQLVGPEREGYGFAWRRLLETGAHLAFGSDWPVVTPDVRKGLHAALTRTNSTGEPKGGWQPQQCVTLAQGLDGYTRRAAYAERQEHQKGTLRPGMLADLTIFGADLFQVPPAQFTDVDVVLTMVDGRVVHRTG